MYIFKSKDQRTELRKIVDFLLSKDIEISKLGVLYLRKSKLYRDLKPQTVFYYPQKFGNKHVGVRLSTYVNERIRVYHSENMPKELKGKAKYGLKQVFDDLLCCDGTDFFKRVFINSSNIL